MIRANKGVHANKGIFAETVIALAPSYVFTAKNGKVIQPDIEHLFAAAKRDGYIVGRLHIPSEDMIKIFAWSGPPRKILIPPDGIPVYL
jgi:hypothetical protein